MTKHPFVCVVVGSAVLLTSGCATRISSDANAPKGPPSATLSFEGGQAGYWLSAAGGKGTLRFRGKSHRFTAVGASALGSGAQGVSASGKVYNLSKLSDFPGTYTGARSGITLISGQSHAKLQNEHGVVIYLSAQTSGFASSTGVSTVTINLD